MQSVATTKSAAIVCSNILPLPLKEQVNENSEVWLSQLQFQAGQRILLRGGSGKGKSTFLHIIYGLRKDFTGDCTLAQNAIVQYSASALSNARREQLSIVFQDLRLLPNRGAMENILIKNQLSNHKSVEEIKELAHRLEIQELLEKPINQLSFGQRQRVALIRALCQPFQWLLLDEPFAHLDPRLSQIALKTILEEVEQQGAGLILASLDEDYGIPFDQSLSL